METSETKVLSSTVLALAGRLDGLASLGLEKKVDSLFTASVRHLVFDCSQLAYTSSAGLRVFLSTAKKFKAAGGRVAFAALTSAVQDVFELSGFLGMLEVHPTVAAATAALG